MHFPKSGFTKFGSLGAFSLLSPGRKLSKGQGLVSRFSGWGLRRWRGRGGGVTKLADCTCSCLQILRRSALLCSFAPFCALLRSFADLLWSTPTLGRGVCATQSKNGRSRPRKPFISRVFCAQRGLRSWSQTMVSEGAGPWGRGRSGDCDLRVSAFRPRLETTAFWELQNTGE